MRQRRFAFTLVEILVVLSIVTLLAALLFAVFSRVREGGRRTVCLSNQKQILLALQLYEGDNAGTLPRITGTTNVSWVNLLLPYFQESQLLICPTNAEIEEKTTFGYMTFPNGVKSPAAPSSYIANQALRRGQSLASVVQPASTIFLSDGAQRAFPQAPYWTDQTRVGCGGEAGVIGYLLQEPSSSRLQPEMLGVSFNDCYAPNPRHNGRANIGFVDGHVKSMDLAQWYFPDTPYLDPKRGG